ncbi:hypothetical protein D3C76_1306990 [compost metagenome]
MYLGNSSISKGVTSVVRLGRMVTSPSLIRRASASRTGERETQNCAASETSSSGVPGLICNVRICLRNSS